jgi:hypothetical protein
MYEPQPLIDPVILREGYTPPELSQPVYLCVDASWVDASLAPPTLPALTAQGAGAQQFIGSIDGPTPAPHPPALALNATALMASSLSATLQPSPNQPLALASTLDQNLDLPDNGSARLATRYKPSYPKTVTPLQLLVQHGQQIRVPLALLQQHGTALDKTLTMPAAEMIRLKNDMRQKHQHGLPLQASTTAPHAEAIRTRASARTRHAHGIKRRGNAGIPHAETIRRRNNLRMRERQALPAIKGLSVGSRNAWRTGTRLQVRWAKAAHPQSGYWWPEWWEDSYKPPGFNVVIPTDRYTARPLHCDVILGTAYPPQPPCPVEPGEDTIIIPVREEYYVINNFALTLVDGTPVPTEDFSASIDADSWAWSWSARIPGEALELVRPDTTSRVELIATINGEPIRVLVESIGRDRKFGESWLRISGRGRAAYLAEPLAPVLQHSNTTSLTALQCLEDVLKTNGVPIGWAINWQIADWQIPAGLWSHSGTWMEAAKRIAEAGGGYVQADDSTQTLHILPKYPAAPWAWSATAPDIQLPEDVVEVEGIDWEEKPDYNAVWVHGGDQGRADQIVITGTDGGKPAPTIVDTLATDSAMTRQRGLAVLGDTGKQATISLRLPVLPETGMIKPGKFVEYIENGTSRRGLVRSLSIAHRWPQLWQTIGVETHE